MIQLNREGLPGRRFHVACKTGTTIEEGAFVSQQVADGLLVPTGSAGAGPAIGKATHDVTVATAGQRCLVETDAVYKVQNGLTTDAFSEASVIGSQVFALNDRSCADNDNAGTLQPLGTFRGMDADGMVRVFVSPENSQAVPRIQAGRVTLAAGVKTISAGITITATSRIFASRVTEAGTDGDELRIPDADRTVGGPGTGAITIRAFLSGVAATSDTSTVDYMIVG